MAGTADALPADFLAELAAQERAYLAESDPIRQSGFAGGPERWRLEREPILDAVTGDGDLLDVGCANGYLLECLVAWGAERHVDLRPYGVDAGERLARLADRRLMRLGGGAWHANAWDWVPPRRFRYVYSLLDCVPRDFTARYVARLVQRFVAPGGRLIAGLYGSRSRAIAPPDVAAILDSYGYSVSGAATGGHPVVSSFAWLDLP